MKNQRWWPKRMSQTTKKSNNFQKWCTLTQSREASLWKKVCTESLKNSKMKFKLRTSPKLNNLFHSRKKAERAREPVVDASRCRQKNYKRTVKWWSSFENRESFLDVLVVGCKCDNWYHKAIYKNIMSEFLFTFSSNQFSRQLEPRNVNNSQTISPKQT